MNDIGGQVNNFKFFSFKFPLILLASCLLLGAWFLYTEIYTAQAQKVETVGFEVKNNETVAQLADRLEKEQVIRSAWFFKKYLVLTGIDREVNIGEFEIKAPVTLARVVEALSQPGLNEYVITIIPGWTIRDIAVYLENLSKFQQEEITEYVGLPAVNYKTWKQGAPEIVLDLKILKDKPWYVSYEGYLAPETYRIYKNAAVKDIVQKLLTEREKQITPETWADIEKSGQSFFEILTMASILEREVKNVEDKKLVADIFWRRYDRNWALQADSTVHYAVGKTGAGELFTTDEDRASLSPWNTYKYPGLPIGPICNPSLDSIKAALYSEKNDYWYFLTTPAGEVKYAKTLEEQNENRILFLK